MSALKACGAPQLIVAEGLSSPGEAVAYLRGRGELEPATMGRDAGDWGGRG